MNRYNKVLTFLLLINLIAPIQATVDDKSVTTQVADGIKQGFSRYNEILIALTVAGVAVGLFWYYCSGAFVIDERLLKGPEMIEKMGKEIAELRSLLQSEAAVVG